MRPRSKTDAPSRASDAVRELRRTLGLTQQGFAVFLGISLATVARYETDRTPRGPMLSRFVELSKEHGRSDLEKVFRLEQKLQFGEWLGIGAAARMIYKKTLRPEVLTKARLEVTRMWEVTAAFEDVTISREHAVGLGKKLRRDLADLALTLCPSQSGDRPQAQNEPRS